MILNPQETYHAGVAAFDRGNFPKARLLASQCMAAAPKDSYLHFGALGLLCWAANYLGDSGTVERDAARLLSGDAGADQGWFDGLAFFNLGLVSQRTRRTLEARAYFTQASQRYAAYEGRSSQPYATRWTGRLFTAITRWAASGEPQDLRQLAQELAVVPASGEELGQLAQAAELYLRRAGGEDVAEAAETAAQQGVSRALLAYILLERRLPATL
jgi:hypothetical protein